MYCPNCGANRAAENIQFCVKCGHDLAGSNAAFQTGIKHSLVLFLIGILLIPVWMFIGAAFPPNDRLVESAPSTTAGEAIAWIAMWVAFITAAARIGYAVLFQRSVRFESTGMTGPALQDRHSNNALPAGDAFEPVAAGKWKTTSELKVPVGFQQRTSGEL